MCFQIPRLCAEEVAAQEQTGQVEECLKVNLLKIKHEGCKKVPYHSLELLLLLLLLNCATVLSVCVCLGGTKHS